MLMALTLTLPSDTTLKRSASRLSLSSKSSRKWRKFPSENARNMQFIALNVMSITKVALESKPSSKLSSANFMKKTKPSKMMPAVAQQLKKSIPPETKKLKKTIAPEMKQLKKTKQAKQQQLKRKKQAEYQTLQNRMLLR